MILTNPEIMYFIHFIDIFGLGYKASNLFLSGVAFHQVRVNPMAREKWPGQAGCRGTADDWGWGIKPRIFMGISWEYHGVVRGCTSSKFFFSQSNDTKMFT